MELRIEFSGVRGPNGETQGIFFFGGGFLWKCRNCR